jgi:hypothetical protein
VILRGNAFNVGDRITMGGVRGDVIGMPPIQVEMKSPQQGMMEKQNGAAA